MSIADLEWRGILVPVFLVAQALLVHATGTGEHPPEPPVLARFPAAFGRWTLFREDPIDAAIGKELGADFLLSQTYIERPTRLFASLLVAWFQTQHNGDHQPHSPKMCLPGSGWTSRVMDKLTIGTAVGQITINRYIVDKNEQHAVVLYWYQTPRRVIASEWAAKFWLAADALRDKRTDTALVRVIVWPGSEGDQAGTEVAAGFARNVYPILRGYLPQ
jgi:EpsI family protein